MIKGEDKEGEGTREIATIVTANAIAQANESILTMFLFCAVSTIAVFSRVSCPSGIFTSGKRSLRIPLRTEDKNGFELLDFSDKSKTQNNDRGSKITFKERNIVTEEFAEIDVENTSQNENVFVHLLIVDIPDRSRYVN